MNQPMADQMTCCALMRDFQSRAPPLCETAQLLGFMDGWDGGGALKGVTVIQIPQPPSLYLSLASVINAEKNKQT